MPGGPRPDTGAGSGAGSSSFSNLQPYQSAFDLWNATQNQPVQAGIDQQIANLQAMFDYYGGYQGVQAGNLQQQLAQQLQGLGIQQSNLGIEQGALSRQQGYLPQEQSLANQLFGIQGQQLGLTQQGQKLSEQSLADQLQNIYYQSGRQSQQFAGGQAASGAFTSSATTQGQGDIAHALQEAVFGNQQAEKQLGLQEQGTGLAQQQLGLERKQSDLSFAQQAAALGDQQGYLANAAKSLKLSGQEFQNQTKQALDQLGLSTFVSERGIYQAIIDQQNNRYNPLQSLFPMIYGLSQLPGGGALAGQMQAQATSSPFGQGSQGSGSYSPQQVVNAAKQAGFTGQGLLDAVATALAESGGNPRAGELNDNPRTSDYSVSPWQINYFGSLAPGRTQQYGSPQSLEGDINAAARAAYAISGGGRNFSPWSTFTDQAYRQYLPEAEQWIAGG